MVVRYREVAYDFDDRSYVVSENKKTFAILGNRKGRCSLAPERNESLRCADLSSAVKLQQPPIDPETVSYRK